MSEPQTYFVAEREAQAEPPAPTRFSPTAVALAAQLAGKLCHDFVSPSGAIVSGLDLLRDPSAQDMRDEALGLIESSARKMVAIIHFARVAFGASSTAEQFDSRELEQLTRGVFAHIRAALTWNVEPSVLEKPAARALLNLAQLGGGALPTGGDAVVTVTRRDGELAMTVDSRGPRARLKAEVVTGLRGEALTEGLSGQWIQAFWLFECVRDAGGRLEHELSENCVIIRVVLPEDAGRR
jgi:histidine phosphotransferase ChpT